MHQGPCHDRRSIPRRHRDTKRRSGRVASIGHRVSDRGNIAHIGRNRREGIAPVSVDDNLPLPSDGRRCPRQVGSATNGEPRHRDRVAIRVRVIDQHVACQQHVVQAARRVTGGNRRRIRVRDRPSGHRGAQVNVHRGSQIELERLRRLHDPVVDQCNRDRRRGLTGSEIRRAAGCGVIGARQRSAISRRVVHRDRKTLRRRERQRERDHTSSLIHRRTDHAHRATIIVRSARASAIVVDGDQTVRSGNRRIRGATQRNVEGLGAFERRVVDDRHRHGLGDLARRKRQQARCAREVGSSRSSDASSGVAHRHRLAGDSRQRHRQIGGTDGFVDTQAADREGGRRIRVDDDAVGHHARIRRGCPQVGHRQTECFVVLVQRISNHRGAHQHARGACSDRCGRGIRPGNAVVGRDLQIRRARRAVVHTTTGSRHASQGQRERHGGLRRVGKTHREHGKPGRLQDRSRVDDQRRPVVVGPACAGAIIHDRARPLRIRDGGIGRIRQVHEERLAAFESRVVDDADRHRLTDHASRKRQRAAGCGVIGARQCAAVRSGIVHRHRHGRSIGHSDREGGRASRLVHGHIVDHDRGPVVVRATGAGAVVHDRAGTLRIRDRHIHRRRQVDLEALGTLVHDVICDDHGNRLADNAWGEGQRARHRRVISARRRRPIDTGVAHRNSLGRCRRQRDREGGRGNAFVHSDVVDHHARRRRHVNDRRHTGGRHIGGDAAGDGSSQAEVLVVLIQQVVDNRGAHESRGCAGRNGQRRAEHPGRTTIGRDLQCRGVVQTQSSRAGRKGKRKTDRKLRGVGQAHREYSRPSILIHGHTVDRDRRGVVVCAAGAGAVVHDRDDANARAEDGRIGRVRKGCRE